jgi:LysM repeat protein
MNRRQMSIVVALIMMNYVIFSIIISAVIGQNRPQPTPTRTPNPTFTPGPTLAQVTAPPPTPTAREPTPTNTLVVPPTPTPRTERVVHIVQPGETLGDIANMYGSPLEDVMNLNGLTDPNSIQAGQELIIPVPGEAVPALTPTPRPVPPTAQPPTDTPVPAEPPPPPEPVCAYQFCPAPWYAGDRNDAITRVYGHLKDTAGNYVNGFFVRLMCPGYEKMTYPSGPSSVAPNYAPGWYDIVMPEPVTLDCKIQVVMYQCDPGTFFDPDCPKYDPLSEAVAVSFNAAAGETIVVAGWTCYHDCDKGMQR